MCLQCLMKFHHCLLKILRKNQNVTDGRTERRTDDPGKNNMSPSPKRGRHNSY